MQQKEVTEKIVFLWGAMGESEAKEPFSCVRMAYRRGDAMTHLLVARSQSLKLV